MRVKVVVPGVPVLTALVLVGVLTSACGGGPSAPPTLAIQKAATASGDGQTDTVLSVLPNPLRVVLRIGSTPQPGDTVKWATSDPGASVSPTSSVTDATGVATTMWKLGHIAGAQIVTATHNGATGSPVTFTATATPGVATQLIQPTGDGQAWMVGTVLPKPLTITVADQYGNGVSNTAVAWQVTSGSASVSPTNTTSTTSGVAQTSVTLGNTAGPITITATSGSLAGSPHQFNVTAQAIPTTASVTVGPGIVFTSDRNSSSNPAVDTIAAGGKVTWTWAAGSLSHSVQSTGSPSFTSSMIQTSNTYSFTFSTAGTYQYNCAVHGSGMTGTIVVR
jgi:plastocyanin